MIRRAIQPVAFAALSVLVLACGGCVYDRSALAPAGDASRPLAALGWPILLFFTATAVVMWALLAWTTLRRTGSFAEHEPPARGGGWNWVLIGGFLIPTVTFATIFTMTLRTMADVPMSAPDARSDIRVVGHQWWWEVEYLMGDLPLHVKLANEIHIPVGTPVQLELRSADVIHSLWIPRLAGKVDLIPGQTTRMHLEADHAGTYPGSCAELCGVEHANMKLTVVAEDAAAFDHWLAKQREPAADPVTDEQRRGRDLLTHRACVLCHTVRGTSAMASVGPDLTHIGSRRLLAASLPNDTADLHAWIVNAPSLKPGAAMPALPEFRGDELHDLVAYLQSLK